VAFRLSIITYRVSEMLPIERRTISSSEKVSTLKTITNLGWGECAARILAEELEADQLLIDD
jgi:predicted nucleic acid-binding protein